MDPVKENKFRVSFLAQIFQASLKKKSLPYVMPTKKQTNKQTKIKTKQKGKKTVVAGPETGCNKPFCKALGLEPLDICLGL